MNKLNTLTSLQAYFPACTAEQLPDLDVLIFIMYTGVCPTEYIWSK